MTRARLRTAFSRAFLEPVDLGNVRMIQRGERSRLALEACEPLGIVRECFRQDLQGDVAPQPRIARSIHLTHPAFAKFRDDFVGAQFRAW